VYPTDRQTINTFLTKPHTGEDKPLILVPYRQTDRQSIQSSLSRIAAVVANHKPGIGRVEVGSQNEPRILVPYRQTDNQSNPHKATHGQGFLSLRTLQTYIQSIKSSQSHTQARRSHRPRTLQTDIQSIKSSQSHTQARRSHRPRTLQTDKQSFQSSQNEPLVLVPYRQTQTV